MNKTYSGIRVNGCAQVFVAQENETRLLDPAPSLKVRNHSSTGFNWGYGGSGPAQLALAILLDHTGDEATARHFCQDFKSDVVSCLEERWTLPAEHVESWLASKTTQLMDQEARAFPRGRWS